MSVHHHHPIMAIRRNPCLIRGALLAAVALSSLWLVVCR